MTSFYATPRRTYCTSNLRFIDDEQWLVKLASSIIYSVVPLQWFNGRTQNFWEPYPMVSTFPDLGLSPLIVGHLTALSGGCSSEDLREPSYHAFEMPGRWCCGCCSKTLTQDVAKIETYHCLRTAPTLYGFFASLQLELDISPSSGSLSYW